MNSLEMLLAADKTKIKEIPTGKIEIKRLSKALYKPFYVTFKAATLDQIKEISDTANDDDSQEMIWTIYEMTIDPDFKSKELREAYGITRPVDIVPEILLGGEILTLYNAITKLSGFEKKGVDIEEIKN
jgi:hypothetical protein